MPVSHVPLTPQSVSRMHAAPFPVQRPVSLTHVPPVPQSVFAEHPLPGVGPPLQRLGSRSPVRKRADVSGIERLVVLPVEQSAVPVAFCATVFTTHVLVAAPPCEPFGIGRGGPKKQPVVVHWRKAHEPPGQSPAVVHAAPWFVPPTQRLPPACAGVVPVSVRVVPLHEVLMTDVPMSGMIEGSGTATASPPKYRPPHEMLKNCAPASFCRLPQVPPARPVVNRSCDGAPPAQLHVGPTVVDVVLLVDVVVVLLLVVLVLLVLVVVLLVATVVLVVGTVVVDDEVV